MAEPAPHATPETSTPDTADGDWGSVVVALHATVADLTDAVAALHRRVDQGTRQIRNLTERCEQLEGRLADPADTADQQPEGGDGDTPTA